MVFTNSTLGAQSSFLASIEGLTRALDVLHPLPEVTITVLPDTASRLARQDARDLQVPSGDFADALSTLRQEMEACSPDFQRAFLSLNLPTRFHLVEIYFGSHPHRILKDANQAIPLVRFLGESGFHRELAVSVFSEDGATHAVLSLGETEGVTPEAIADALVAHTHPLTEHDIEELFLPSDPDINYFLEDARRHSQSWRRGAGAALAVYDPEHQIFKNWIVSPYGASRTEVEMGADGLVAGVRVFYAVRPGFEDDERVKESLHPMRLDFRAHMKEMLYLSRFEFLRTESHESILDSLPKSLTART